MYDFTSFLQISLFVRKDVEVNEFKIISKFNLKHKLK